VKLHRKIIGLFISLTLILVIIATSPFLETFELKALDILYKIRGKEMPAKDIVIVEIEKEIEREELAILLDSLKRAKAVGLILPLSHPSTYKGDLILADSLKRCQNVYLGLQFFIPYYTYSSSGLKALWQKESIYRFSIKRPFKDVMPYQAIAVNAPLSLFLQVTKGVGHTNLLPDNIGVMRKVPLLIEYDGRLYPSMSLSLALAYLGRKQTLLRDRMDFKGRMAINFSGGRFPTYSATEILKKRVKTEEFEGRIVVVGFSKDEVSTPYDNQSSLTIYAEAVSNIIKGNHLSYPPFSFCSVLLITLGLIAGLVGLSHSVKIGVGIAFMLFASYLFFSFSLFCWGVWMKVVSPLIGICTAYLSSLGYRIFVEKREREYLQSLFGRYVSPLVIDGILKEREFLMQGRRKELTILFCDIADFSQLIEGSSPEDVLLFLNQFFSEMTEIIFQFGGTVDKFIGDGMLVFFGDPAELPDHALCGIKAAICMQKRLEELNRVWKRAIRLRIGINTGIVTVGNVGSNRRLEYTVLGENVNLAYRLQQIAEPGSILVSEKTHLATLEIDKELSEEIKIKGFAYPIKAYKVLWR
jgi:adenylate cyclase